MSGPRQQQLVQQNGFPKRYLLAEESLGFAGRLDRALSFGHAHGHGIIGRYEPSRLFCLVSPSVRCQGPGQGQGQADVGHLFVWLGGGGGGRC